jgi:hypothetical protein
MTKYEELKSALEKLVAKNEAAKAKLEVYMSQLSEYGCDGIDAAKKLLADYAAKSKKLSAKIDELTADIEGILDGKS